MKAYKGFNKDMTCRGFQYKEGETFETDQAKLCRSGFHACERPLDVFGYYSPANSVYHCVDLGDVSNERESGDTKLCARKIHIGTRLSIGELVKAQIKFAKEHCTTEFTDPKKATAGYYGAATAGDSGAATAGDYGAATSRGKSAVGKNGVAVARGNGVKAKGDMGAVIVLVEESVYNCDLIGWKVGVIDGETLKPDTWYKLENGEFVEVEE
jgi:hypothetical protein